LGDGVRMAGPDGNAGPGDVVEVPIETAQILIANGSATAVETPVVDSGTAVETPVVDSGTPADARPDETATLPPRETATARPQRKRSRK
jgi:hypothetical protein